MSPPECGNCARPTDGYGICGVCAKGLAEALRGVPALLDDLLISLAKQDRLSTGAGRRASEPPMPFRADIPDAIWALGNVVTTWARELAEAHGWTFDTEHLARPIRGHKVSISPHNGSQIHKSVRCELSDLPESMCAHCRGDSQAPGMSPDQQVTVLGQPVAPVVGWRPPDALDSLRYAAEWLADRIGHLRRLVDAMQAHDEITDAIAAANEACSAPPLRIFTGPCEVCGADLYGWPDGRAVACRLCGEQYTDMRKRWDAALEQLRGRPATAAFIARCVGSLYGVTINRKAINLWHHRRRLEAVAWVPTEDDPEPGAVRFLIGDVLDLARGSQPRRAG